MTVQLEPLPESFAATRDALHMVAEHVLAPARYRAEGRIGLIPTPSGIGTPAFGDGERVRIELTELVYERPGSAQRVGLTTLGAAAQFVGVELGAPLSYSPSTSADTSTHLDVDRAAAAALFQWYALAQDVLTRLAQDYTTQQPSAAQLWPEHFDLACELGDESTGTRANYGASPGDGAIAEPYLYVGPWDAARRTGALGTHPWGAALEYRVLLAADDSAAAALMFFTEHAALLLGDP
ncbi:MAG TPA: hypothetical protein VFR41_13520 [Acidimicrobiia bacterium]|nr:hypothetical protein [Acidimicrobiia bacterium]